MGLFRPKKGEDPAFRKIEVRRRELRPTGPEGAESSRTYEVHPDDAAHCWFCGGELGSGPKSLLTSVPMDGQPLAALCHPGCFGRSRHTLPPA